MKIHNIKRCILSLAIMLALLFVPVSVMAAGAGVTALQDTQDEITSMHAPAFSIIIFIVGITATLGIIITSIVSNIRNKKTKASGPAEREE